MKKAYPNLTDKERTIKARETFFNSVCKYIEQNHTLIPGIKEYFTSLKKNTLLP